VGGRAGCAGGSVHLNRTRSSVTGPRASIPACTPSVVGLSLLSAVDAMAAASWRPKRSSGQSSKAQSCVTLPARPRPEAIPRPDDGTSCRAGGWCLPLERLKTLPFSSHAWGEGRAVDQHPVHDHRQLTGERDHRAPSHPTPLAAWGPREGRAIRRRSSGGQQTAEGLCAVRRASPRRAPNRAASTASSSASA